MMQMPGFDELNAAIRKDLDMVAEYKSLNPQEILLHALLMTQMQIVGMLKGIERTLEFATRPKTEENSPSVD